jgi:tetratricopeptide (TPR) repeat protein
MDSKDDLWNHADRIFDEALDLPSAERPAFLDRACGEDPELRALVDRLLASADDETSSGLTPGGALQGPLWNELQGDLAREDEPGTGTLVGRYRIVRELGRGGMAVVYLAERADGQFEQQVALKLLKRGVDTDEVVGRFDQERQILALARHPGLARLLDGGVGPGGRPYLVMEYVAGRPIDLYADDQRLSIPERLRLFLQVARTVEDAHRNLVVHRDIKPSNILVTGDGHAKLLDFGIAKLLDPDTATPVTRTASRMLTPAYASPEQLEGGPVTTASDVYQLGLLLYLLLAGRLPDRRGEGEPARPSGTADLEEAARARLTTPARLRRELAGDLDTLVLTALRKEPERRYGSVAQLIDDVERYLAGRPISARSDTLGYRTGKFVRRHTAAVATAATALVLLFAVVVLYTVQLARERDRARLAAAQATQVAVFLRGLFEVSAPTRSRGEQITARQLLDQGAARIDADLADQPEVQAEMMTLIGDVYHDLALYAEAEEILERAVALRRERPGNRLGLAASLHSLARVLADKAEHARARKLYGEALALREAALGPDHPDVGRTLDGLGRVLSAQSDYPEALRLHRRAVSILEASLGPDHVEVGQAIHNLGYVLWQNVDLDTAGGVLTRGLAILEARLGPDHPQVANARVRLADYLAAMGEPFLAREQYERALPVVESAYGPKHPAVALVLSSLAILLSDNGEADQAIAYHQRALKISEAVHGPRHPQVAFCLRGLGIAWLAKGDLVVARGFLERSAALLEEAFSPDHDALSGVLFELAGLARRERKLEEAERTYERVLAIREKAQSVVNDHLILPLYYLGQVRVEQGNPAGAEGPLRRALALTRLNGDGAVHGAAMMRIELARALTGLGRFSEAEKEILPLTGLSTEPFIRRRALNALASLYDAWKRPADAARQREALAGLAPPAGSAHP